MLINMLLNTTGEIPAHLWDSPSLQFSLLWYIVSSNQATLIDPYSQQYLLNLSLLVSSQFPFPALIPGSSLREYAGTIQGSRCVSPVFQESLSIVHIQCFAIHDTRIFLEIVPSFIPRIIPFSVLHLGFHHCVITKDHQLSVRGKFLSTVPD